MATGLPDFQRGVDIAAQSLSQVAVDIAAQTLAKLDVDIIAQSLAKLDVDIIAQSLAKLDVDIIAQTISNLSVDIAAQTLANLNVDITAQTLANLNVDIAAQTLANLKVDIAAQTLENMNVNLVAQTLSELNIDIIAQSLSNLNIDVNAQSLSEIVNRPKYGGAEQVFGSVVVGGGALTRLVSISGKGVLYGGTVWLDATLTQANSEVQMKLDDAYLSALSFVRMSQYGVKNPISSVFSLNTYDAVNHIYSVGLSTGITFESYLDLYYYELYSRTPNVFYHLIYALI